MAKISNLRPSEKKAKDDMREWMIETKNHQTVAYGNKVAGPTQGTTFYDSSGAGRRWDGDVIADFDTRITEGKIAIEAASESLALTEQDLSSARDRIAQVEADTDPVAIGNTAAAQINDRQLLIGRDAILTGTLDVAQLNVTETMSAELVKAMSVESKKLVVTEDAILNRVTVIQDIVTPSLVAQKINSALITGSVIQTNTAANTGVKIDSTGYKAYDSAGNLAVDLNGKDNLIIGTFSTSAKESSGVKLSQTANSAAIDLYTPDWGGNSTYQYSHAGMWYAIPSRLSDRGLNLIATDYQYVRNTDPGLLLKPGLQQYGFQGAVARDFPGTKSGSMSDTTGIPSGSYKDYTFTFASSMKLPTNGQVAVFPSIVNQNKRETMYTVFEDTATGFKLRVVNPTTGSTGTVWIKWIAVII